MPRVLTSLPRCPGAGRCDDSRTYYFPAAETSVELSRSPSVLIYRRDWIVLTRRQAGQDIQVAITTMNDSTLAEAWNALVSAGAIPAGPPPQVPG